MLPLLIAQIAENPATTDTIGLIVGEFLSHGVMGLVAMLALWGYWKKDTALGAERDARLADQKEMIKLYYELAKESESTLETAVNLIVHQTRPKE